MTQIVNGLPDKQRFHYVERSYSGFVALRIVIAVVPDGNKRVTSTPEASLYIPWDQ